MIRQDEGELQPGSGAGLGCSLGLRTCVLLGATCNEQGHLLLIPAVTLRCPGLNLPRKSRWSEPVGPWLGTLQMGEEAPSLSSWSAQKHFCFVQGWLWNSPGVRPPSQSMLVAKGPQVSWAPGLPASSLESVLHKWRSCFSVLGLKKSLKTIT